MAGLARVGGERWEPADCGLGGKADRVLGEPPLHIGLLPDPGSERVGGGVGMRSEEFGPVSRPLLVEMPKSSLSGYRSREDDYVGQGRQRRDKSLGKRRLDQMGDLEAEDEIEAAADVEWLAEVGDLVCGGGYLEEVLVDPGAVDPEDVVYAVFRERGEPRTETAAHVHHAVWRDLLDDERN